MVYFVVIGKIPKYTNSVTNLYPLYILFYGYNCKGKAGTQIHVNGRSEYFFMCCVYIVKASNDYPSCKLILISSFDPN